ncbi:MAG: adenylyl-sulfate kinase [Enhydrobacter sp.]|nr:adenylyl-sulfate kinase [Enhydrobacter sp.]
MIWITGYSAAGKTTVGRRVEAKLRQQGVKSIFLDGDDLRSIFAGQWGFARADRINLAKVYFRLSSHLASQGFVVVISAVAMYREVSDWIRENIPNAMQILLDVPEGERVSRDSRTKKLYDKIGSRSDLYDEPTFVDFTVKNYEDINPEASADEIVRLFDPAKLRAADFGRVAHWAAFYSSGIAPETPSSYAKSVLPKLASASRVIEIGCGNGRDASYFHRHGHLVTAIDLSEAAIEACRRRYPGIDFVAGRLPDVPAQAVFDVAYSRFVLHAMPLHEEVTTLDAVSTRLKRLGRFYIECRSINDPLARQGEVISPTERIAGHYRRFIILHELIERLGAAGFRVVDHVESDGLAIHKDDNPVVIRITAEKQ